MSLIARNSALGLLLASSAVSLGASTGANSGENLGDALLEEGLGDLFPGLEDQSEPAERKKPSDGSKLVPSEETLRRMMEQAAGAPGGEDVGDGSNPLATIAKRMGDAGRMVGDGQIETAALPLQKQAVADLDRLIAEMEKQSSSSSSQQQQQKKQQQSQRSQSKPAGGKPSGGKPQSAGSQQAAMQATGRPQGGAAEPPSSQGPVGADALKAAWGHLPQRVREQMLQSSADEFLPEYREAIEAYYRRLAEDNDE